MIVSEYHLHDALDSIRRRRRDEPDRSADKVWATACDMAGKQIFTVAYDPDARTYEIVNHDLQNRMIGILAKFIEPDDRDVSDAEFVYRLKKRFDLDWNRHQTLVDPNE